MSKPGSAGIASESISNVDRRERLRQLALETVDLDKDPYFMKNHLGSYECKLCLTLHTNEGSYLAHTQGKRHQQNLARRAAKMAKDGGSSLPAASMGLRSQTIQPKKILNKIGTPGYKIVKQYDPAFSQLSILFRISYPKIADNVQPRHRFMSSVEQRVEVPNMNYQYVLFAAEPYETVAFKVPSLPIDKKEGKFLLDWNREKKVFTVSNNLCQHTSHDSLTCWRVS